MRTIDSAAADVLEGPEVVLVTLVEMLLTQPIRMASSSRTIVFDGDDYLAVGNLGTIDTVEDSPGEYKAVRFNLSAVSTEVLAIALEEDIRGKPCSIRMAVLDPDTHAVLDAPLIWSGTLDQMPITLPVDASNTFAIGATAEHRGMTYARPKPLRYTDVDQRRMFAGDTSLRFMDSQANHPDVWPAASYFRK